MMHWSIVIATIICAVNFVVTTNVQQCPNENKKNLKENIIIGKCVKPPCRLRKNTRVLLKFKFVAEEEYKNLTQIVEAKVSGLDLPFIGVDGTSPCDKIYLEDEKTKSNCKFEKGKIYVFKDGIDILPLYPTVRTVVHWSITDSSTGKHAVCFEVPASITN
ncbi:NPC intracellular cholesterol transporter 2 homolog a isoform X2 [Anthonomus grandis grandis]|uniref:NPC intracellular cholesterol transporter 2 homolog a isoform X2 n=1 Tax=Anthonomus grandis grandis TaxID=2921223 RepID=UPI002165A7DF|nr:NPC intracellular cholesterol transporter 2 homolog a isoform X2 [Anthonomus grandis grandis]